MEYNVDYFIDKFSKIPEDKWVTGTFSKPIKFFGMTTGEKMCAQGHCMPSDLRKLMSETGTLQSDALRKSYPEWKALVNLFGKTEHIRDPENTAIVIAIINNNDKGYPQIMRHFPQRTARGRVLAALLRLKVLPSAFDAFKEKKVEEETTTYVSAANTEIIDEVVKKVAVSQN